MEDLEEDDIPALRVSGGADSSSNDNSDTDNSSEEDSDDSNSYDNKDDLAPGSAREKEVLLELAQV